MCAMINNMDTPKERILIVEDDPTISDLIARQTLLPLGYRVQISSEATTALQDVVQFNPDLIIVNLNLSGLSGKDLLVAFSSQGLDVPVIVLAEKGMEGDVIQAFRLGAADFLTYPIREAEVVAAVERILKQVRARREKDQLSRQLTQANQELQRRVRELTTIFAIGKAVVSITDLRALLDKIIEGAVYVTEAEIGWLLTRDERSKTFILSAFRNLPRGVAANLNKPWDDGLSSLVALSGETLAIHGEPLNRFRVSALGKAAMVVPVKVKNEVVGLIVVVRKAPQPFSSSSQALLEAVADYASIAIVNARLFRALEERVKVSQQALNVEQFGERIDSELMQIAGGELATALSTARSNLSRLAAMQNQSAPPHEEAWSGLRNALARAEAIAESLQNVTYLYSEQIKQRPDLNVLVRHAVERLTKVAQSNQVSFHSELPSSPVFVEAHGYHVLRILDSLLANAVRRSPSHGQVAVRVEILPERIAHVGVRDRGDSLTPIQIKNIFETDKGSMEPATPKPEGMHFSGLGISLGLAKRIATTYGGNLWLENNPDTGITVHFTVPLVREQV